MISSSSTIRIRYIFFLLQGNTQLNNHAASIPGGYADARLFTKVQAHPAMDIDQSGHFNLIGLCVKALLQLFHFFFRNRRSVVFNQYAQMMGIHAIMHVQDPIFCNIL